MDQQVQLHPENGWHFPRADYEDQDHQGLHLNVKFVSSVLYFFFFFFFFFGSGLAKVELRLELILSDSLLNLLCTILLTLIERHVPN